MRILYHHRTLGDGAEGIHIREMIKAFRQIGYEIQMAGPVGERGPTPGRKETILVKMKHILPTVLFEIAEIAYSLICFFEMTVKIRRQRPNFIYDRYITYNFGGLLAAKLHKVPYVLEVNAPLAHERSNEPDEQLFLKKIAFFIEKAVCSRADHTIVVSTPLKNHLESIGVPRNKCVVMPNGVDPKRFTPRQKNAELIESLGIPSGEIIVGFTGILRPWHGLEMLIEAVRALRKNGHKVYLLIVGDGPLKAQMEEKLQFSELKGYSYITGRIPHEEIPDYVNLFDIAVSPKATFYASPMKVVEYMAMGKAVIVPGTPNFCDMVTNFENGLLFEENSLQSFIQQLTRAIECPELLKKLGAGGVKRVASRLNWEWNAKAVVALTRDKEWQGEPAFFQER